ncbi:hypothetical protein EAE96_009369 [Botrytis aclada]|nr:hypothetical protein EAE96_009369 [Botrytis aclada]
MAIQNVTAAEQHSDVLNEAVQSPAPPSYEEEMSLPSYEEAISDLVPEFPAAALQIEAYIKLVCTPGDSLVEQALESGEDVLSLNIEVEQNLIHACAIYPITSRRFRPYITEHRVHLFMAGRLQLRILAGSEDIEWGVERVEARDDGMGYEAEDETDYNMEDETDDETRDEMPEKGRLQTTENMVDI